MGMSLTVHLWHGYVVDCHPPATKVDELGKVYDRFDDWEEAIMQFFVPECRYRYEANGWELLSQRNVDKIEARYAGCLDWGARDFVVGWDLLDSWEHIRVIPAIPERTAGQIEQLKDIIEFAGLPRPDKDPEVIAFATYG